MAVSGLESTLMGGCLSVDSKRVCRLCGDGSCGRTGVLGSPGAGPVLGSERQLAVGCWVERLGQPALRSRLRGWDEILRSAQDDRRGKGVRCGLRGFVGPGM